MPRVTASPDQKRASVTALADAQMVSTNTTANAFLGSRRPAWLTANAIPPAAPTAAPSTANAAEVTSAEAPVEASAAASTEAPAEALAPPSPTLNLADPKVVFANLSQSDCSLLSPAPTDEASPAAASPAAPVPPAATNTEEVNRVDDFASLRRALSEEQRRRTADNTRPAASGPSTAPSQPQSAVNSPRLAQISRQPSIEAAARASPVASHPQRTPTPTPPVATAATAITSPAVAGQARFALIWSGSAVSVPPATTSESTATATKTTTVTAPTGSTLATPDAQAAEQNLYYPRMVVRATPSNDLFKYASYVPFVQDHIDTLTREGSSFSHSEALRLSSLIYACRTEDAFFVALNQLLSLWLVDRTEAHFRLPSLPPHMIDNSFGILQQVLENHGEIRPTLHKWLSRFPRAIGSMLRVPTNYDQVIVQVCAFLKKLVQYWGMLWIKVAARGYPLLMDELLSQLLCVSPTLQKFLSGSSRKALKLVQGYTAAVVDQIFQADQAEHQPAPGTFISLPEFRFANELERINSVTIECYRNVIVQGPAGETGRQSVIQNIPRGQVSTNSAPHTASSGTQAAQQPTPVSQAPPHQTWQPQQVQQPPQQPPQQVTQVQQVVQVQQAQPTQQPPQQPPQPGMADWNSVRTAAGSPSLTASYLPIGVSNIAPVRRASESVSFDGNRTQLMPTNHGRTASLQHTQQQPQKPRLQTQQPHQQQPQQFPRSQPQQTSQQNSPVEMRQQTMSYGLGQAMRTTSETLPYSTQMARQSPTSPQILQGQSPRMAQAPQVPSTVQTQGQQVQHMNQVQQAQHMQQAQQKNQQAQQMQQMQHAQHAQWMMREAQRMQQIENAQQMIQQMRQGQQAQRERIRLSPQQVPSQQLPPSHVPSQQIPSQQIPSQQFPPQQSPSQQQNSIDSLTIEEKLLLLERHQSLEKQQLEERHRQQQLQLQREKEALQAQREQRARHAFQLERAQRAQQIQQHLQQQQSQQQQQPQVQVMNQPQHMTQAQLERQGQMRQILLLQKQFLQMQRLQQNQHGQPTPPVSTLSPAQPQMQIWPQTMQVAIGPVGQPGQAPGNYSPMQQSLSQSAFRSPAPSPVQSPNLAQQAFRPPAAQPGTRAMIYAENADAVLNNGLVQPDGLSIPPQLVAALPPAPIQAQLVAALPPAVPAQPQPQQPEQLQQRQSPRVPQEGTGVQQPEAARPGSLDRSGSIFPPAGSTISRGEYPLEPTDHRAFQMSLTQLDRRSPSRVMINRTTQKVLAPRPGSPVFYQFVQRLALGPCSTPMRKIMYTFEFSITDEEYALRCFRSVPQGGLLPVENHFDGSMSYRVRCCTAQRNVKAMTESEWVTSNTQWPVNIFIRVNNTPVFVRRQSHNGKDLPVGITQLIQPGVNRVEVAIPEESYKSGSSRNFFFGVETIETAHGNRTIEHIKKHGIEEFSVTIDKIKSRLQSVPNGDDEFAILQNSVSVDLADPFSARIFKIPVRGNQCQHIECFDLYNWLHTRPPSTSSSNNICQHRFDCKCPKSQEPTMADKWRCPICSKDARPSSLRIDRFLISVRAKLKEIGKLDKVKSILVAADGKWEPIGENEDDEGDDSDNDGAGNSATSGSKPNSGTANSNATKRRSDAQEHNEQQPRKAARTGSNPNAAASATRAAPASRSIDIIEIDD